MIMDSKAVMQSYINGWKLSNSRRILATLSSDCVIIESHGPTYRGLETVRQWIDEWTKSNRVEKWEITSFYSCGDMIFCEWHFVYNNQSSKEEFDGVTIARIRNGKIESLREYRMTAPPYEWRPVGCSQKI